MAKHTPLYDEHLRSNATMVDFYGWEMPLHYGSQIKEHHAVRNDAGMFDVSHMTIVDLLGAGGRQFLRNLLANDVDRLAGMGKALYSCMLNNHGGVLDDCLVYSMAADNYRLVLNSATYEKDLRWLRTQANDLAVGIQERLEMAMIAIQGPCAIEKTLSVLSPEQMDAVTTLQNFETVDINGWFFARTGYTGEHGLEIILPGDQASTFWQTLLEAGVQPCGLGARDTLRLEAGMMLYGQDMDESTTPFESSLSWSVAMKPSDRDFIGRAALQLQQEEGVSRRVYGLILQERGIMRPKHKVMLEGIGEGVVTSGTFSPTLQQSIALARLPVGVQDHCLVEVRGKPLMAKIVKPRFVKFGKIL